MTDGENTDRLMLERHAAILNRLLIVILLLVVVAAGTLTSAVVDVMDRKDAKDAGEAIADAVDGAIASEYGTYAECMDAIETSAEECDAAFPG